MEALARHEASQNVTFPDIESLSISATTAAKSSGTFASQWTDCTNVTFSKVLRRFSSSNLAQHKEASGKFLLFHIMFMLLSTFAVLHVKIMVLDVYIIIFVLSC